MSVKLPHYFAEKTSRLTDHEPSMVAKLKTPQTWAGVRTVGFVIIPNLPKAVCELHESPPTTWNGTVTESHRRSLRELVAIDPNPTHPVDHTFD